jgi:hypothetical protein
VLALALLIALYVMMWGVLIHFVGTRPDPDDRPVALPRGVQEGEPVRYAVEALTPPSPPERVEVVATSVVRARVTVAAR